jgi:RimJ/RimL family protein N-acetyltransferase
MMKQPMTNLVIRQATEDDAERLLSFAAQRFAERLPVLFESVVPPSLEDRREFLHRVQAEGGVIFVADNGREIVGVLDFHRAKRPQAAHGGALGMSVTNEHRRRGVGAALLQALLSWTSDAGISRIELEVFDTNAPAIRLYERMGFQHEGRRRQAVIVAGRKIDILLMARLLEAGTEQTGDPAQSRER